MQQFFTYLTVKLPDAAKAVGALMMREGKAEHTAKPWN